MRGKLQPLRKIKGVFRLGERRQWKLFHDAGKGKKQMNCLATFYTHYGAVRYHKICVKTGIPAKMSPVPRELSASCGVCVRFEAPYAPKAAEHEDMEHCYVIAEDGAYSPLKG